MKKHLLGGLCITALLLPQLALGGGIQYASGTNPIQWKVPNVKYYVNPAGSEDITDGSDLQKVDESYSDWYNLSCSSISAANSGTAGTSNMLTNGQSNGKSEVTWIENSAWKYGSGVLGITSPLFYNNGTISEADIALNGLHHTWTTQNPFNKVDTKSIVLHEVGHWYGIQHYLKTDYPANDPPTMAPAWDGSTKGRTLEDIDIGAFCFLYGNGSCSSDVDCPLIIGGNGGNETILGEYTCSAGQCTAGGTSGGSGGGSGGGGDDNSCDGYCSNQAPGGCYCDPACEQYNDCCLDYEEICVNGGTSGGGSQGGGEEGTTEEEGGEEGTTQPTDPNGDCPGSLDFTGCCNGLILTWCDNGLVQTLNCSSSCGWDGNNGFYNCNMDEVAEPTGQYPLSCEEAVTEEGGGAPAACDGGIEYAGCCDGLTLTWCGGDDIKTLECSESCGWDSSAGFYNCNKPAEADPSGNLPLICPGGSPVPTEGGEGGTSEGGSSEGGTSTEEGGTPGEGGGESSQETEGGTSTQEGGEGSTATTEGGTSESGEEATGDAGGGTPDFCDIPGACPDQQGTENGLGNGYQLAPVQVGQESTSGSSGCQSSGGTPWILPLMGLFLLGTNRRRKVLFDQG